VSVTVITTIAIVGSLVLALAIALPVLAKARSAGAFGPSKKDQETAQRLFHTGSRARGTILTVQPTGMVVNHINIGVDIIFQIDPLDGSPSWQASKNTLVNQTQMPRMGDIWPVWYDPADPATFAVGAPGPPTPEQIMLFREFGIQHPLDHPQP